MLLRAAHCFAPHLVDKEVSSCFGNFDSIKLISANVFYKGSSRKYLGLPGPYRLFGNDPPLLLEWLSSHNTLFTNAGCGSDSALGPCGLLDPGADHRPAPLCFCPCSSSGTNSTSEMNSTQWRESKDEHFGVAAAAFIVDVSLFGRVALKH